MSSGTRVVLGYVLFAALVFAILAIYARDSGRHRDPDNPAGAARRALQADNTVVGLVGGISSVDPIEVTLSSGESPATARLEARVVGGRDSGRMVAELSRRGGVWEVSRARFTLSDGTTIPVAGSAGR